MSARSPSSKRGRKKKSNKGRKPKKPLSKEEIAAKKNQKNMRETCRRVEINLHYELLYHSLGQNLVYNRAERVQLLRKAIIKMAELKTHVKFLTDQVRASGMSPRSAPKFQLNGSQKLFMLVQRWARNDNGKKCSRAKLKPVGIEIVDDNHDVPITTPADGRITEDNMGSDDNDHIPFWASWETNTYIVVDQDAFEKACNQAIIAGWDGKLGSKGARYIPGLPNGCGLTIAQSGSLITTNDHNHNHNHNHHHLESNNNTNNHNNGNRYKYKRGRNMKHDDDVDVDDDDEDDEDDEEDDIINHRKRQYHNHHHRHSHNDNVPLFPPRIDFPEIVAQGLQTHHNHNQSSQSQSHSSCDSRSENNSSSTSEPPIKKQKLNNGRTRKRKRNDDNSSDIMSNLNNNNSINLNNNINNTHSQLPFLNSFNIPQAGQFVQHSMPLSVPFPAVNGPSTFVVGAMQSMANASPFMNVRMNNSTPEHMNQSSSDTGSQHSYNLNSKYSSNNTNNQQNINVNMNNNGYVKSEPLTDGNNTNNNTPQPPQFPVQVSFPQFLTFPPQPTQHQFVPQNNEQSANNNTNNSSSSTTTNNLVPVMTFPMFRHPILPNNQPNNAIINNVTPQQQHERSNNSTPNPDTKEGIIDNDEIIINDINDNNDHDNNNKDGVPSLPPIASISSLPPIPQRSTMNGICSSIPTHNKNNHLDIDEKINTHDDNSDDSNNHNESTPPPNNNNNHHHKNHRNGHNLSPSGSRTSHETRNSLVFTPANHSKNSSAISTDSNTPSSHSSHQHKNSHSHSTSPRPEKSAIHLPDNTSGSFLNRSSRSVATTPSIENYENVINWNNNNNATSTPQGNLVIRSDDYSIVPDVSYDSITSHPMGIMNDIPVSGFQDASTSTARDENNGLKGSAFY